MPESLALLRSAATIRERCANIARAVDEGRSERFTLARGKLAQVVDRVEALTRARYPALAIPYHSRWRHFEAGGVDRKARLDAALAGRTLAAQARSRIDLTVVSVLLDAGAGPDWRYVEALDGATHLRSQVDPALPGDLNPKGHVGAPSWPLGQAGLARPWGRSEGLGVASFHAFMAGLFSSDPGDPNRVDAAALKRLRPEQLALAFQVSDTNPLVGLTGRATLLNRLGEALQAQPELFGGDGRPGGLFDALTLHGRNHRVSASRVLAALLEHLGTIWPPRDDGNVLLGQPVGQTLGQPLDQPLGDCWRHPLAGGSGASAGWVPFHKLSQWLCYSLLEPFEWAGVTLTDLDALTGLPEYRNGGLLLDAGVIVPRDPLFAQALYRVADPFIVEWRALTVSLLDDVATQLRLRLGRSSQDLPLACVLEGGTWAAGRRLARECRADGSPPLRIDSDGTVF